jgi:hypothetical protein
MEKLMVHVHQIFMHETVMRQDFTVELARLVPFVARRSERSWLSRLGKRRISGKHKEQAINLADWESSDSIRQASLA